MPERAILTAAWELLKNNAGIENQPDSDQNALEWLNLMQQAQAIYEMQGNKAQRLLAQKIAIALTEYYTTLCEITEEQREQAAQDQAQRDQTGAPSTNGA